MRERKSVSFHSYPSQCLEHEHLLFCWHVVTKAKQKLIVVNKEFQTLESKSQSQKNPDEISTELANC